MVDGNSKKIVNKKKEIQKYVARISWPLLLSEKELLFLENLFKDFSTVSSVRPTSQTEELFGRFYKNVNKSEVARIAELRVSLFGINFSGKETSLLSRVIITNFRFSVSEVMKLLEDFSMDRSSILFVALVSLSTKKEMTLVTIPMVKVCLHELLLVVDIPAETRAKILFFDKYFLGSRFETFYMPKDGGVWVSGMEKNAKEVYRESMDTLFSVVYYLRPYTTFT